MLILVRLAIVVLAIPNLFVAAGAVERGDPEHGRQIAARWCASCHLVDGQRTSDRVRSLAAVGRDTAWTADRLRGFLAKPHDRMPDASLTRQEIEDLIAYLHGFH